MNELARPQTYDLSAVNSSTLMILCKIDTLECFLSVAPGTVHYASSKARPVFYFKPPLKLAIGARFDLYLRSIQEPESPQKDLILIAPLRRALLLRLRGYCYYSSQQEEELREEEPFPAMAPDSVQERHSNKLVTCI